MLHAANGVEPAVVDDVRGLGGPGGQCARPRRHHQQVFLGRGVRWCLLTAEDAAELIAQANLCLEAGCELVLVEAAELMENGEIKQDLLADLRDGLDIAHVLFELTGYWIKGTTVNDIFELQKAFVLEFGPDVNIANVQPDTVISLEALRCGLSVIGPERLDQAAE